ncbi:glycine cleavage system H protein [Halteromyces radiatus]|uniref:glycine cleavage system H protein n=1 Tax=Halteromyces radiatus TaxID=101107 RepID=UPI00221FC40D|nr:glycine cleavage system H protein [Halteromyces radiatus]KAI8097275.1 glycine cleavage system H protein [Halteromyces radiatus]
MSLRLFSNRFVHSLPCLRNATSSVIYRSFATKKYTLNHEWISVDNNVGTIGITDHAQQALGDVVFVEFPYLGKEVVKDEQVSAVESVNSLKNIYSPASGEVLEVNDALVEQPSLVNDSPEEEGWLMKLNLVETADMDSLLDETGYAKHVESLSK